MCGSHSPHANGNERLAGAALQPRYSCGAVAAQKRRIGTVAAAYPQARRNAAAVYPRASCKSAVPRGFSEPRSLRCLQRSSWIQSGRQQRACTAHAPQMHRAYAADAPCQAPYLPDCSAARGCLGPCSPRAHSGRDSPLHCSGGLAGRATMCGYVVRGSRCEWVAATMTRRQ